jgi:folylpolyglutamate synthase/dihydropteroate synthase
MLQTKDPAVFADIITMASTITAIPVTASQASFSASDLSQMLTKISGKATIPCTDLSAAIAAITETKQAGTVHYVLLAGSLYLAQAVLTD